MKYRIKRKFSNEFKREAVKMSLSSPETLVEIALRLDVHPNQLSRWRQEWIMKDTDCENKKPVKNIGPEKGYQQLERENKRLKKELERANLEVDILKKLEEYVIKKPQ